MLKRVKVRGKGGRRREKPYYESGGWLGARLGFRVSIVPEVFYGRHTFRAVEKSPPTLGATFEMTMFVGGDNLYFDRDLKNPADEVRLRNDLTEMIDALTRARDKLKLIRYERQAQD